MFDYLLEVFSVPKHFFHPCAGPLNDVKGETEPNEDDNEDQQSHESNSENEVTDGQNEEKATDSESSVEESVAPLRRVCAAKETPGPSEFKTRRQCVVHATKLTTEMMNFQNK